VLILVLNDWYLKSTFSNVLTGKLSDFAGLFAFPFFLSALFPRRAIQLYVLTLLLFTMWKSAFIQPFIDFVNGLGLPIHRTVDYTDLIALTILPFSFYIFKRSGTYSLKPFYLNAIVIFSALAFIATTRPPGSEKKFIHIDKTYSFNFSKRELIARLNLLQLEFVRDINKYGPAKADFDGKSNIFYYGDRKDTIARILDFEKVKDTDTIRIRTLFAELNISGNDVSSEIKLLSLNRYVPTSEKGNPETKTIEFFEKNVIRRIKSYK
jgi:hypothetical protein